MDRDEILPDDYELIPYETLPPSRNDLHVYPEDRPWNRKKHVWRWRSKCWCGPSRVKQAPMMVLHVDRED